MYRACSTWQYDVVSHLVETRLAGTRLGFVDGDDFDSRRVRDKDSPRISVLKYHDAHPAFAIALSAGEAVAIYGNRDMRDVAYSYMHKAALQFDEIVRSRFIEKLIYNDNFWRSQHGLLCQRYEAILANEKRGVHELAGHLGITLRKAETLKLVDEYSWQSNFRRPLSGFRSILQGGSWGGT